MTYELLLLGFGLGLLLGQGIINAVWYVGLTPNLAVPPVGRGWVLPRWLLMGLQGLAYLLTGLRLPFGVLPYVAKALLYWGLGGRFAAVWQAGPMQGLRAVGDGANWLGVGWLLRWGAGHGPPGLLALVMLCVGVELARLLLEKGQMGVSAGWQCLPHAAIARGLRASPVRRWTRRYIYYYRRSPAQRCAYVLRWLRCWLAAEAAAKVGYVRAVALVGPGVDLRAGLVRDVGQGAVFVRPRWSNDPWLVVGLVVRRSPWLFDPRYLRRPFFYRTEANPHATALVWEHALYCAPFALYQLGHELKAARFALFFGLGRWLGQQWEVPVQADGVYGFDPLLRGPRPTRALWTTEEVLAEVGQRPELAALSAAELAGRYVFPLEYVEVVLLPLVRQVAANRSATTAGTSQCG